MENDDPVIDEVMWGTLHQSEIDLLVLIRSKYRYGIIQIEVRDGLPTFLQRTIEREKVG